jgi:lipopolysaccharide biosynthesis regulator YciM
MNSMSSNTAVLLVVVAVVVLLAVAIVIVRLRRRPAQAGNPYIEGLRRLVDGDRPGAFEKLQAAVRSGLAPTDAYIRLGKLLRENGDPGKALQIHKSLTVKADLTRDEKVELVVNIAEDYSRLGRAEQAVGVLETALRKMGLRDGTVYTILARESHRLGRTENAYGYLRDLKKTDSIGDREIALYLSTAGAEMAGGNEERRRDARRTLQRALKHDPDCAPAHLALGDLDEADGDDAGAIQHWRRAAVLSAELSHTALSRLEKLMFEGGRFSEVEKVYREVLAARPGDEYATLQLASFYRKQGRVEDAIEMLEDFRAGHPRSVEGTLLLTAMYASARDHPRSVEGTLLLTAMYASARDSATLEKFLDENGAFVGGERYACSVCGEESDVMRWHCRRCNRFDTFEEV